MVCRMGIFLEGRPWRLPLPGVDLLLASTASWRRPLWARPVDIYEGLGNGVLLGVIFFGKKKGAS